MRQQRSTLLKIEFLSYNIFLTSKVYKTGDLYDGRKTKNCILIQVCITFHLPNFLIKNPWWVILSRFTGCPIAARAICLTIHMVGYSYGDMMYSCRFCISSLVYVPSFAKFPGFWYIHVASCDGSIIWESTLSEGRGNILYQIPSTLNILGMNLLKGISENRFLSMCILVF